MKKAFKKILSTVCAILACTSVFAATAAAEGTEPADITSFGGKITYNWANLESQNDWTALQAQWGDNVALSSADGVWWWKDQRALGINNGESAVFKFDMPDDATEAYLQGIGACLGDTNRKGTFYISKNGKDFTKLGTDGHFVPWVNVDISAYLEDNASKTVYIKVAAESADGHDAISLFLQVVYSGVAKPEIGHPVLDTEKDDYVKAEKYLFTATNGQTDLDSNMFADGKLGLWGELPAFDEGKTLITDYGYKYEKFGPITDWASESAAFFFDGGLICHQPASTGGNSYIFEVPVKAAMKIAALKLNMAGPYDISLSTDGTTWTPRASSLKKGTDGVVSLDLTNLLDGTDKTVYVRVAQQDIAVDSTVLRAAALTWEEGSVLKEAPTTAPTTAPTKGDKPTTGEPAGIVLPLALLSIAAVSVTVFCCKRK